MLCYAFKSTAIIIYRIVHLVGMAFLNKIRIKHYFPKLWPENSSPFFSVSKNGSKFNMNHCSSAYYRKTRLRE